MKKKLISLMLSVVLISSFSITVKASETDSSMNSAPSAEEIILPEEEETLEPSEGDLSETPEVLTNDPTEEITTEASFIEVKMHPGEIVDFQALLNEHVEEDPIITDARSSLVEGELDEAFIGLHEIHVTYQNSDGTNSTSSFLVDVTGKPVIQVGNTTILNGEPFTLDSLGLSASDHEDGDLTEKIILKESPVAIEEIPDETIIPEFSVLLSVTDQDGNETIEEVLLTVETNDVAAQAVVVNDLNPEKTITLSGANRFRTATAISQAMYVTTDAVIVVSATNFPDALSAGPLAKALQAPILLTNSDNLSSSTEEEITRLGATKVYILGGEAAVSASVENEIAAHNLKVERISGSSRYTTAIAAAKMVGASKTVILANGNDFADAMSAGSYAAINGFPILLTKADSLSTSVKEYLESGVENIIIIGGENAISSLVENELRSSNKNVTRISGSNRISTSLEMATYAFKDIPSAVVTNGFDFADALTAVPYAASLGLPVVLTSQNRVNTAVTEYLIENSIENFHFIGGEAAISNEVKSSMMYPSLYSVSYRSMDLKGNWTDLSKNGEITGTLDGSGISHFEIQASEEKDIYLRYAVSLTGLGWQPIKESGAAGVSGRTINGLVMELKGKDAVAYDITYRTYIKGKGWTEWVIGGIPSGGTSDQPILAVEAKIIHGSALNITRKIAPSYGIVRADLNLRAGEGTNYAKIGVIPNGSRIKILSTNGLWAYVRYTDINGKANFGYAHTGYIDRTNAIISINGIQNGDPIPKDIHSISGDIAYKEGIKEVNYYVNNVFIGRVDYGYLSHTSLEFEFDSPMQTGYHLNIPVESWIQGQINVLKVEFIGTDNKKEFESRYLMPSSNNSNEYSFEEHNKSFHSYLHVETAKTSPPPQVWSPNGWLDATIEQTTSAMDPTAYVNHDTYKYIFLDLGYSENDYEVTTAQLDIVLKGKGVLDGMGHVFHQAAIDFKVNPFYLIAHSLHETGNGNSSLAFGQQMDYYHKVFGTESSELIPLSAEDLEKKWHNVYGIGAYDSNPILWGKERAYHEKWDTVEKAIYGGAKWIANDYIDRSPFAQNTLYKMRYNLKENMGHQYATDIMWAQNQSKIIKKQFDNMGIEIPLRFIIPSFGEIRN